MDTSTEPNQQRPKAPTPQTAQLGGHIRGTRRFRLLVDCKGDQFRLEIQAQDERTAFRAAAHDILGLIPAIEVHQVRLLSCVEVRA